MANKYTVLVVDDAFFMRGVIKRNIMSHVSDDKFEIIGNASSGADGYKMYNELKPDILTTDINLQDSNGLLVAKRIRKENPRSKIIVISSNYDVEVQEEVINAGFIFIKKPFQQASLSEALDKLTKEIEEDKKIPVKPRVEVKNEQDNTNNKQTGQRNLKGGEVREKNKEDKEILQEKKIDGGNTLFKIPSFNDLDKLLSAEINKQEKVSDKNPIEEMAITPIIEDKPKEIKKEDVSKVKKDSLSDDALDENNAFDLNSLNFNFNFLEDNAPKKEEVLENYSLNNSSNNYKYEYEEDRHSHDLDKNLDLEDDFELDLEDDVEEDSFEEDSFEDDLDLEEDFELDLEDDIEEDLDLGDDFEENSFEDDFDIEEDERYLSGRKVFEAPNLEEFEISNIMKNDDFSFEVSKEKIEEDIMLDKLEKDSHNPYEFYEDEDYEDISLDEDEDDVDLFEDEFIEIEEDISYNDEFTDSLDEDTDLEVKLSLSVSYNMNEFTVKEEVENKTVEVDVFDIEEKEEKPKYQEVDKFSMSLSDRLDFEIEKSKEELNYNKIDNTLKSVNIEETKYNNINKANIKKPTTSIDDLRNMSISMKNNRIEEEEEEEEEVVVQESIQSKISSVFRNIFKKNK